MGKGSDISPKKMQKWRISTRVDAKYQQSLGNCKSKLQNTTSYPQKVGHNQRSKQ